MAAAADATKKTAAAAVAVTETAMLSLASAGKIQRSGKPAGRGRPSVVLIVFILSMALVLSACSFSVIFPLSESAPSSEITETGTAPQTVEAVSASFTDVKGNSARLIPLAADGRFFYCISEEKTGEEIPEEAVKAAQKKKKEAENDGRYDTFSFALYKLRPNGSLYRLPDYESVLPEENNAGWSDFSSVVSVDALTVNADGTFSVLEHTATSGNSMPKDKTKFQAGKDYLEYVLRYYLRTLSRSGAELNCVEIGAEEAEKLLCTKFSGSPVSTDGNAVYDGSGEQLFSLTDAGIVPAALCSELIACTSAALSTAVLSGSSSGTSADVPSDDSSSGISSPEDMSLTDPLPESVEADSSATREFSCLCGTYDTETRRYSYEIARITLRTVPAEEYVVLRLGYADDTPGSRLLEAVADFNRSHDTVSVRPVPLADAGNPSEVCTVDLLYIDNQSCTDLAFSGLLADLYPYLDADTGLKREDYFSNILSAAERNGQLCSTCAGFTVSTVIGEAAIVGDRCAWTYDELREAWGNLGIGTDAFPVYTDREDVFRACLKMDLCSVVSYDAAEKVYRVNSDRLDQLKWFCSNFPVSFDYSGRTLKAGDASDLRLRSRRQLLLPVQLSSFADLKLCGYEFAGEIAFVGYPTAEGCGSTLTVMTLDPDRNFSMTAACSEPAAAWEFLRTFFTAAYQTKQSNADVFFPSHIRCFERGLKAASSGEYAVDKNGELVYDENNRLIHVSIGTLYLSDYTEIRQYPVTEERAVSFRNLVESLTKIETAIPDSDAIVDELCRQYLTS